MGAEEEANAHTGSLLKLALLAVLLVAGGIYIWGKWIIPPRPPLAMNEQATISLLRMLATSEEKFRRAGAADLDGDGKGEFGFFGELSGVAGVRTDAAATKRGAPLSPALLSPSTGLWGTAQTVLQKHGYQFRVFLPAGESASVHEVRPGIPLSGAVATDLAETAWCAYAWPAVKGNTGLRAFYVDATGKVWASPNERGTYSNEARAPAWDAALPAGQPRLWTTTRTAAGPGNDRDTWTEVK